MSLLKNPASLMSRLSLAGLLTASSLAVLAAASPTQAHENHTSITVEGGQRCVVSNGLPDHATGQFPNSGNPNTIAEQSVRLCMTADPVKGNTPKPVRGSVGVAVNGVQIRPGTADYYDASSPRGFSRDASSGWNLEGLGARDKLGMDSNNAHVDERGLYHYHGVPDALVASAGSSLIGYAADGFEIHYAGDAQQSSYRLKEGTRPSAPGGTYDGTYNQDWEYVAGSGTLDACNGGTLNGEFVYFATDSYPFFPRCLWGDVSTDFQAGPPAGQQGRSPQQQQPRMARRDEGRPMPRRDQGRRAGPPQEAVAACSGEADGAHCRFSPPGGRKEVRGTCHQTPERTVACVPAGPPPRG